MAAGETASQHSHACCKVTRSRARLFPHHQMQWPDTCCRVGSMKWKLWWMRNGRLLSRCSPLVTPHPVMHAHSSSVKPAVSCDNLQWQLLQGCVRGKQSLQAHL